MTTKKNKSPRKDTADETRSKSRTASKNPAKRALKKKVAAKRKKSPMDPRRSKSGHSAVVASSPRRTLLGLRRSHSRNHLDDLPERHESHDLSEAAEAAFEAAIKAQKLFLIQRKDQYDYGTDYQIEARDGKSVTNLRAHVQLKGTEVSANTDGSISISVRRANLNYLLAQSDSLYICWHAHSAQLLACYASEVFRSYEHRGAAWHKLAELTVSFRETFDKAFQRRFHSHVLAAGRSNRNRRLQWIATPPEEFPTLVQRSITLVDVPPDPQVAFEALQHLYSAGKDAVIAHSFSRFEAVLKKVPGGMVPAYLAEINLGINRAPFDRKRVRRAVGIIQAALKKKQIVPISGRYCQGNAWLALGELEKAKDCYLSVLGDKSSEDYPQMVAQCLKNLGSVTEALGDHRAAFEFFKSALTRDPNLPEAHMAIAVCGLKNGLPPREALEHLDAVIADQRSAVEIPSVQGWRIEILFQLGEENSAFREIQSLLAVADAHDWIWPYCARQVANYGRSSIYAARMALGFWRAYLQTHPGDQNAEAEQLLCFWMLNSDGIRTDMTFEKFRSSVERLAQNGVSDPALLWDRAGHWAQDAGDWKNAEACFRKAYELEGGHYGYCLGVALNFLGQHDVALPLLVEQANVHQPDAKSWFQVAVAMERTGDVPGCIAAYLRAVDLDPNYELAWFNLGGVYLNQRDIANARSVWNEALRRFPEHEMARRIRREYAALFPT